MLAASRRGRDSHKRLTDIDEYGLLRGLKYVWYVHYASTNTGAEDRQNTGEREGLEERQFLLKQVLTSFKWLVKDMEGERVIDEVSHRGLHVT